MRTPSSVGARRCHLRILQHCGVGCVISAFKRHTCLEMSSWASKMRVLHQAVVDGEDALILRHVPLVRIPCLAPISATEQLYHHLFSFNAQEDETQVSSFQSIVSKEVCKKIAAQPETAADSPNIQYLCFLCCRTNGCLTSFVRFTYLFPFPTHFIWRLLHHCASMRHPHEDAKAGLLLLL